MLSITKIVTIALMTGIVGLASVNANATLITFDDLIYTPTSREPLTNEYAPLDLQIDGGFLGQGGPGMVSAPNLLLGWNYLTLRFLNPMPTFVSMYVSAPNEDIINLTAYGLDGLLETITTQGWGGPLNNTPYTPQQFVSFYDAGGIASINLEAFFNLRTGAEVDNLSFGSATTIPSPPSVALMGIGMLAWTILAARKRRHGSLRSSLT